MKVATGDLNKINKMKLNLHLHIYIYIDLQYIAINTNLKFACNHISSHTSMIVP
jgi:hypothetical protein